MTLQPRRSHAFDGCAAVSTTHADMTQIVLQHCSLLSTCRCQAARREVHGVICPDARYNNMQALRDHAASKQVLAKG